MIPCVYSRNIVNKEESTRFSYNTLKYIPDISTLAVQLLLPTLFFTSNTYSPASAFPEDNILRLATLPKKLILYFSSFDSSVPSLNQVVISSGVPPTVHSSVQESPAVTLIDCGFSTIIACSRK